LQKIEYRASSFSWQLWVATFCKLTTLANGSCRCLVGSRYSNLRKPYVSKSRRRHCIRVNSSARPCGSFTPSTASGCFKNDR
ncbi:hypothetical protein EDC04DRAFT_2632917, partial [Pisolithus marmoratus]